MHDCAERNQKTNTPCTSVKKTRYQLWSSGEAINEGGSGKTTDCIKCPAQPCVQKASECEKMLSCNSGRLKSAMLKAAEFQVDTR